MLGWTLGVKVELDLHNVMFATRALEYSIGMS